MFENGKCLSLNNGFEKISEDNKNGAVEVGGVNGLVVKTKE